MNPTEQPTAAAACLLPAEDPGLYDQRLQEAIAEFHPETFSEHEHVRQLVHASIRLERAARMEAHTQREGLDLTALERVLRYQRHYQRVWRQSFDALRASKKTRQQLEKEIEATAFQLLAKTDKTKPIYDHVYRIIAQKLMNSAVKAGLVQPPKPGMVPLVEIVPRSAPQKDPETPGDAVAA